VTATQRVWRSGLELALFVSTLLVCAGFSAMTLSTPATAGVSSGTHVYVLQIDRPSDSSASHQWTAGEPDGTDRDPADDDNDDDTNDEGSLALLPAPAAQAAADLGRAALLADPGFDTLFTFPVASRSLRAPPQSFS
jgi:hypothetical protein